MNFTKPTALKGPQGSTGIENSDAVWNTERVDTFNYNLENGIDVDSASPYLDGVHGIRKPNLVFDMTEVEEAEYIKCANDVVYFANKYCFAMTDDGVRKIELRDYQKKILDGFQQNRFAVLLASRQIGKTVTASIYICWYMCFNFDKNVLIAANKGKTMGEIIDKVKTVYRHLPMFLKPGMTRNNVESMWFDTGTRVMGTTTTGTAALGFTIHLLYADEFAHIPHGIIDDFYRSIYPTLSASQVSRMIVTSTPKGMNKFWEIYNNAVLKKNEFFPMKVDWWEVPGRDEAWKEREIANLGSLAMFNQEYGNTFLSADTLLVHPDTMELLGRMSEEFQPIPLVGLEHLNLRHDSFKVSRHWRSMPVIKGHDRFVLTIDLAGGGNGDYTVINMFRLEPMSLARIRRVRDFKDETAFFRLRQIAIFRSNNLYVDIIAEVLGHLIKNIFGPEDTHIVLEMNFMGSTLIAKMEDEDWFFVEMFLHTKHSQQSKIRKPGVWLHKQNRPVFCQDLARTIQNGKLVVTESDTILELGAFGDDGTGNYSAQLGNDDITMTLVNLSAYLSSPEFVERVEEIVDQQPKEVISAIQKRFATIEETKSDKDSYAYLKDLFAGKKPTL